MICVEQQTLILPIPGCGENVIKSLATYWQSRGHTTLPVEPPTPWDKDHPLLPVLTKVAVIVGNPFNRLANLVSRLAPESLSQVNGLVRTGELFQRFPVETMPVVNFLQDLPRPKLLNGGRSRVFHEDSPATWGNVLNFLVIPRTTALAEARPPTVQWDVEAQTVIRNYYEKDFDIKVDISYFI